MLLNNIPANTIRGRPPSVFCALLCPARHNRQHRHAKSINEQEDRLKSSKYNKVECTNIEGVKIEIKVTKAALKVHFSLHERLNIQEAMLTSQ